MSFAKMSPERQREIAVMGGRASGHRWTPEEQRIHSRASNIADLPEEVRKEMARLGGEAAQASGNARRWTREQAAEAARKSAAVRAERKKAK